MKKLYIIIVTYNATKWIDKVFSKFENMPDGWNIIVIDNCSKDNTIEIINKKYPFVETISLKKNLGFGKANNIGLNIALTHGAEHALLLNQDAWISVEDIQKLIEVQNKNKNYYIISPLHYNGTGDKLDCNFSNYILSATELLQDAVLQKYSKDVYPTEYCNAACWLLSRECMQNVGGFNPSFYHYGEDDNYMDRVFYNKKLIGIVPQTKVYHDRENRKINHTFFNDFETTYRLKILIKLSNPAKSNFTKILTTYIKYPIKIATSLLKLDFYHTKINTKILLRFTQEMLSIYKNMTQSKKKSANFIQEICPVCGNPLHTEYKHNAICDELANDWQFSKLDKAAFDIREGEYCLCCRSSARARIFSQGFIKTINTLTNSNFLFLNQLIKSHKYKTLKIAEINSCANLHKYLSKSHNLYFSDYGSTNPKIPSEDIMNLSYKNNFFDIVINTDVLEHVPNYTKALSEISRVLKTGGYYIFTVPILFDRKTIQRCSIDKNGKIKHIKTPSFHGEYSKHLSDRIVFWEFGNDFIDKLKKHFSNVEIFTPINVEHSSLCCFICRKDQ